MLHSSIHTYRVARPYYVCLRVVDCVSSGVCNNFHCQTKGMFAAALPSMKLDAAKPPTKKSKFKERRQKSKEKVELTTVRWIHALLICLDCHDGFSQNEQGFTDPFEAMERKLCF